MGEFAFYEPGRISTAGAVDHDGVQITYPATANMKSGYVEIVAATNHDADGFHAHLTDNGSTTSGRIRLDIAIGPAGSERIIVPDIYYAPGAMHPQYYHCPIPIPAGSRISARAASNSSDGNCRLHINYYQGGGYSQAPLGVAEAIGVTPADTSGVVIHPGATAGAKGDWQAVGAPSQGAQAIILMVCNPTSGSGGTCNWSVDIAWGAARSIIYPNMTCGTLDAINIAPRASWLIPCCVPPGETIYVRTAALPLGTGTDELNVSILAFA